MPVAAGSPFAPSATSLPGFSSHFPFLFDAPHPAHFPLQPWQVSQKEGDLPQNPGEIVEGDTHFGTPDTAGLK